MIFRRRVPSSATRDEGQALGKEVKGHFRTAVGRSGATNTVSFFTQAGLFLIVCPAWMAPNRPHQAYVGFSRTNKELF
jgi:hypothetical protein